MFRVPEKYRVLGGPFGTTAADGNNGVFYVPMPHGVVASSAIFAIIASDGEGWEHVSVHVEGLLRAPLWHEMCLVKSLFWCARDCVMQLHPPESDYVNVHPHTLHLWRPNAPDVKIPRPPQKMV